MTDKAKTFSIGIFVVIALLLSLLLLLFLKPSYGNGESTLRVRFPNVEKISVGTRVTFAGKPVGEVLAINEIHEARTQKNTLSSQVYFFELILNVDSSVKVYNNDDIVIQTSGLFGEKIIAIIPKLHREGIEPSLMNDQIIYSKSGSSLQDTFQQMSDLALTVQDTLDKVSDFLNINNNELKLTLVSSREMMQQLNKTLNSINDQHFIEQLNEATGHFSQTLQAIGSSFSTINEGRLLNNLSALTQGLLKDDKIFHTFNNLQESTHQLSILTRALNNPESSLGRFIHSEDFYLRLVSLTHKLEVLFNDINHYGLMFHLDKGWQRTRTKRRNLIDTLATPEHFQRYYEEEMDQISTSLSRTTLMLRKAEKEQTFQSEDFKSSFADLLRKVEALRASLKVYTEDLITPSPYKEES